MTFDATGIPTGDIPVPTESLLIRERVGEAVVFPDHYSATYWCIHCPDVPHRTEAPSKPCPVCQGGTR
jgi:hypothetical protein